LIFAALAFGASACDHSLPARGQVIVVVDTDLPAPTIASRFRADFYDPSDGRWYESRSLAVPDKAAWPLSFGVYSDDDTNDKLVLLRLRIYPDGRERDYRGERYEGSARSTLGTEPAPLPGADAAAFSSSPVVPAPDPRLDRLDDGGDETPATEPIPHVTIDRLVLLRVRPGVVSRAVVTLKGACVGTMARLAIGSYRGPSLDEARTCVDTEDVLVPLDEYAVDSSVDAGVATQINTFGAGAPCRTPADSRYACVASGAFIFGGTRLAEVNVESSSPDRIVRVSSFAMDTNEVSVADYRDAVSKGLPIGSEIPLDSFQTMYGAACPYTSQPGAMEKAAMACLFWSSARAYCNFRGGDLPTEVQWEWAATGGRAFKPRFPWGDDAPSCTEVDFGRAYQDGFGYGPVDSTCGFKGPFALLTTPKDASQFGMLRMGGGVAEWTRDAGRPFTALCWELAPSIDPSCEFADPAMAGTHVLRGGTWRSNAGGLDTLTRFFEAISSYDDFAGFRCVYSTPPGGWQ
jgi:formylglycine-generating enzyme required for sulfatase activity